MWEMWVLSLGQKDPLEKGIAAHSCLENSMDRGTWQATVHGGVHSPAHLPFCKAWLTRPPHTQYLQTSPVSPPRSLCHYPAVLPSWNECLPPTLSVKVLLIQQVAQCNSFCHQSASVPQSRLSCFSVPHITLCPPAREPVFICQSY